MEKDDDNIPKIKVFRPTDESLKLLGELLTNDTSRRIIMTLGAEELYVNKLAEKLDLRVSLVIHHLKKLENLGLVDVVEKPISKRTKNHRFFKLRTDVFLSFTEDKEKNKLKRIFKEGIKFTSILLVGVGIWLTSTISGGVLHDSKPILDLPPIEDSDKLVYVLLVVLILIIIERIHSKLKKNRC